MLSVSVSTDAVLCFSCTIFGKRHNKVDLKKKKILVSGEAHRTGAYFIKT